MTDTSSVWIWEYGTCDGNTVYDTTEYWDLSSLKYAVDASFNNHTWEEVERRGIKGTSVLVDRNGRYVDTGHWVYRRPEVLPPWFPGVPGSRWRDVDGDVWTHRGNGYVYMDRRPNEPGSPEVVRQKYGPMTLVDGENVPDVEQLKAEYVEAEAAWAAIPGDRPTDARQDAWKRVCDAYDALVDAGVEMEDEESD